MTRAHAPVWALAMAESGARQEDEEGDAIYDPVPAACAECHIKKRKCDGRLPCGPCRVRGISLVRSCCCACCCCCCEPRRITWCPPPRRAPPGVRPARGQEAGTEAHVHFLSELLRDSGPWWWRRRRLGSPSCCCCCCSLRASTGYGKERLHGIHLNAGPPTIRRWQGPARPDPVRALCCGCSCGGYGNSAPRVNHGAGCGSACSGRPCSTSARMWRRSTSCACGPRMVQLRACCGAARTNADAWIRAVALPPRGCGRALAGRVGNLRYYLALGNIAGFESWYKYVCARAARRAL